jgi:1-acyl-sn-glycerol-3-phosphate acyltransferase
MGWIERLVNGAIRLLTGLVCRVDEEQLQRIPHHGPLIIVANHINFIETPLAIVRLRPRPATGFAKAEWWRNPITRWLFSMWGAIPLRRGEGDVDAFRQAFEALEEGKMMVLAPEGTRSGTGQLKRGQPGVALLALRSGAPILPLGFYGYEHLWRNMARLRRTDFHVVVGRPFRVRPVPGRATSEMRQAIADQIMYQIAALLPEAYRGAYADRSRASDGRLEFLPAAEVGM